MLENNGLRIFYTNIFKHRYCVYEKLYSSRRYIKYDRDTVIFNRRQAKSNKNRFITHVIIYFFRPKNMQNFTVF